MPRKKKRADDIGNFSYRPPSKEDEQNLRACKVILRTSFDDIIALAVRQLYEDLRGPSGKRKGDDKHRVSR